MFKDTGQVLLQTAPASIRPAIDKCMREVSTRRTLSVNVVYPQYFGGPTCALLPQAVTLSGVLECRHERVWSQAPGSLPNLFDVRS